MIISLLSFIVFINFIDQPFARSCESMEIHRDEFTLAFECWESQLEILQQREEQPNKVIHLKWTSQLWSHCEWIASLTMLRAVWFAMIHRVNCKLWALRLFAGNPSSALFQWVSMDYEQHFGARFDRIAIPSKRHSAEHPHNKPWCRFKAAKLAPRDEALNLLAVIILYIVHK